MVLEDENWDDEAESELNLLRSILEKHPAYIKGNLNAKSQLRLYIDRVQHARHAAVHQDKYMSVIVVEPMLEDD